MGLDQYLWAKLHRIEFKDTPQNVEVVGLICGCTIHPERVVEISEEAMYWRKSNHIHRWFVDNVQDGNDDCKPYYVEREQLITLLELVKKVIAIRKKKNAQSLAEDMLPTSSGFFFGSAEYSEWYWKDLEETRDGLTRVLKDYDDRWSFEYCSSW